MASIRMSVEKARGCGYRAAGGKYLVAGAPSEACPKLPVELSTCPCCGAGIKPSRAWTWITPDPLLDPGPHGSAEHDAVCPLGTAVDWSSGKRAGLIWIGEKFYKTPAHFMAEAREMGVSRRVNGIPRGFKVGEDWIALGHPKAIAGECEHGAPVDQPCANCADGDSAGKWLPGIITFYRPEAAEYIVKGDETEEQLDHLETLGYSLVRVVKAEQAEMEAAA